MVTSQHPALAHTGIAKMHLPTLLKGVEILDDLLLDTGKTLAHVWGYDPDVSNTEHHSGRALDFMVHSDEVAGDHIAQYVIDNAERLGLIHVIWRQRIYRGPRSTSSNPKGVWQQMADRGSTTQNHLDHPHVWFAETDYIPPPSQEQHMSSTDIAAILDELRGIRTDIAELRSDLDLPPRTTTTTTTRASTTTTTTSRPPVTTTTTSTTRATQDTIGNTLRRGDRGKAVTEAQRRLTAHGFTTAVDGSFGPAMETSVKDFQRTNGLDVDGVIGPKTWEILNGVTDDEGRAWLRKVGWRRGDTVDVRNFQQMFNLGAALSVDGSLGPRTRAAIQVCIDKGDRISAHFKPGEFMCKCGGKYANCERIKAHRALVRGAEKYRTLAGPFTPLSAYRCPSHNAAVGGYVYSQHLYGTAMDLIATFTLSQVKALGEFRAIGINRSNSTVRHVDYRHLSGRNDPPAGTTSSPHVYYY